MREIIRLPGLDRDKKLICIVLLHPVPFYGRDYETSNQSLFGLQDIFRKVPFLVICHQSNFDDLIQSCF